MIIISCFHALASLEKGNLINEYGSPPFFIVGPPELFKLNALPPRILSSGDATLRCEVNGLDQQKLNSYQWQWKFQERVIEENEKYRVFYHYQPPKFCQQSRGSVILHIRNVSNEDLGQYICALQLSNIALAEIEIPFYDFGKFPILSRVSRYLQCLTLFQLTSPHLTSSHLTSP